eukprot:gnl/TRDRNA2_/TRDRNA2_33593_c0_seq1.p1 gnl/TRDRNA2_/TRDRNA2_33593_c0~~gnl/TRDRNA2_/TRDRNA2_33593_c0_seq1.p1  ORF type:complete len:127 (-),score=30.18 gnl/TRDRNA2_/TRDRNA2_33593_c0_seq1:47-427(-)
MGAACCQNDSKAQDVIVDPKDDSAESRPEKMSPEQLRQFTKNLLSEAAENGTLEQACTPEDASQLPTDPEKLRQFTKNLLMESAENGKLDEACTPGPVASSSAAVPTGKVTGRVANDPNPHFEFKD